MDKIHELQYIYRMGLPNLKPFSKGYMCTCVKCGTATPYKRKLYILTEGREYITVFCQRCGYDTNLRTFIKDFFPLLYQEYEEEDKKLKLENLKNGTLFKKEHKKPLINTDIQLQYKFHLSDRYFKPAREYSKAIDFCKRRQITDYIDRFYYCIHPDSIMSGMIIFPFVLDDNETLYGFQGRHTDQKLFFTHSKNESIKCYNIFNVNPKNTVYIFESIIDSLMIDNAIAMLGTSLSIQVENLIPNRVYIFDNDKVGVKRSIEYLEQGSKCVILPPNLKFKDFNEAVCKYGYSKDDLMSIVNENTLQGLAGIAKAKFKLLNMRK